MKILFTVAVMDSFHGSVMHVLELSNFLSKDNEITIITTYIDKKVSDELEENIRVIEIDKITESMEFDLIWSYHFPLLGYLLKRKFSAKKIICGSLSSFEYLETFPFFWSLCSMLHCISEEAALIHTKTFDIPKEKIKIMENIVPLNYSFFAKENLPKYPENIAIVSNYAPIELKHIKDELRTRCNVTFYGGKKNVFITPKLLLNHDLIITIGKTVQYSLVLGIPVYNYGRFGGDGYITKDNISFEKKYNFSGRPNNRKLSTEEICNEIYLGYAAASYEAKELREIAKRDFLISNCLNTFLSDYESLPDFDNLKLDSYNLYLSQCDLLTKYICKCNKSSTKFKTKIYRFFYKLFNS